MSSVFTPSQAIAIVLASVAVPACRASGRLLRGMFVITCAEVFEDRAVEEWHRTVSTLEVTTLHVVHAVAHASVFRQWIELCRAARILVGKPDLISAQAVFNMF